MPGMRATVEASAPPRRRGSPWLLACWLALWLVVPCAHGLERGTSSAGVAFMSGGASEEEQARMRAERPGYSFWLTTAARGSGAYLAGVRVRITDESGQRVLEHTMDGPWLYAALPLGRYEVEAALFDEQLGRLEIQRGSTAIHPGDRHSMVLYFIPGDMAGEARTR